MTKLRARSLILKGNPVQFTALGLHKPAESTGFVVGASQMEGIQT